MEWTDEVIARLQDLWSQGLSTAEIGRQLSITKNAVVGKAHRLGLPPRPSPIRKTEEELAAGESRSAAEARTASPRSATPRKERRKPQATPDAAPLPPVQAAQEESRMNPEPPRPELLRPELPRSEVSRPELPRSEEPRPDSPGPAPSAPAQAAPPAAVMTNAPRPQAAPPRPVETEPKRTPPRPAAPARPPAEAARPPSSEAEIIAASLRPMVRSITGESSVRRGAACCWPIGDPGTPGFHFCGAKPLPGKPYCAEHAALAYVKLRDRRDPVS
ncbi:GcrA family cell cycle regulator [Acidomonas methanolica]|uniref:GcrA family cell cycle regulator n=1 Tax=Acidomonas methanolica TaxID=437 RepID=UPI00211A510A|nr:GcrA family cell cycle regulator [Acidomonas methanolica]MCQ9154145.1 GcrA cell cycle regulator [Acidomonas methanolica]